jgi:hypothetical protein
MIPIEYNPGSANVISDALSCKYVPPTLDGLIVNLEWMDILDCFAGVGA